MTASRSEQLLRTTDLSLATYLIVQGFTAERERVGGDVGGHPQGAWVFTETPALRDVVAEFNDGDALVEPVTFHHKLNSVRRDMFKFLGIGQG